MSGEGRPADYVIVGAGPAGCVLANRLSADADTEVLLLEAGTPDENREIGIPAAFSDLFQSGVDWDYHTAAQSELHDRELYWPRGKTLGGSSSINAMIYVRGQPADYDHWADLGNDGWGYEDVLPYFMRAEDNERAPRITTRSAGRATSPTSGRRTNSARRSSMPDGRAAWP